MHERMSLEREDPGTGLRSGDFLRQKALLKDLMKILF